MPNPTGRQVGGDHYQRYKVQPAEFLRANNVPHAEGEAIYHILRHRDKAGAEDLDKAIHWCELIKAMEYGRTVGEESIWVYVAGPYTSEPKRNTDRAIETADCLLRLGYVPVVPHLTHLWHQSRPHDYRTWLNYGKALGARCDVILRDAVLMPGESPGADEEERSLGLPVCRSVEDLLARFPVTTSPADKQTT